tara:strand:- start:1779 stop:2672 length:894 start_codon:yes stop_codon:yes gene_type:complete
MVQQIKPTGFFTQEPILGGGSGDFSYLIDPSQTAGAYKALIDGSLLPTDVGNYDFITSRSPLTAGGPFNLLPTAEGALTLGVGAINPFFGFLTRQAINNRNTKALETLANEGILTRVTSPEQSGAISKALGSELQPGTGQYRLSDEIEQELLETGETATDYFKRQFSDQFGQAQQLANYLDQVAYTTQGQFFQKDLFGNPTSWSKYIDRSGNIKPDALEKWQQFGQDDSRGVLKMFDKKDDAPETRTQPTNAVGIDTIDKGVSEARGDAPDFLDQASGKRDAKGRRIASGTTNLLLG